MDLSLIRIRYKIKFRDLTIHSKDEVIGGSPKEKLSLTMVMPFLRSCLHKVSAFFVSADRIVTAFVCDMDSVCIFLADMYMDGHGHSSLPCPWAPLACLARGSSYFLHAYLALIEV